MTAQKQERELSLADRLIRSLETQEELVEEVQKLRFRERVMRWVLIGMSALTLFSFVLGIAVWRNTQQIEDARLDGCRVRNGANEQLRAALNRQYDVLADLTDDPESEFVTQLRATILPAEATDIDCNSDGVLDEEDYA